LMPFCKLQSCLCL